MIRFFYILAFLTFFISGCYTANNTGPEHSAVRTRITSENFATIAGMQWQLRKITKDGSEIPLSGERPFVRFEKDGKVAGFASINRFFGSIKLDTRGNLELSPLGSTRMAGPEQQMKQELIFLSSFQSIEQLSTEGIHLYASTKNRQTELVFYVPVN